MTDIFDIKNNLLGYPINIYYSLAYILIFFILFFLLKKFLQKDKKDEFITKKQEEKKINFIEVLDLIKDKYLDEKKEIFYFKLWEFIRWFLEKKYSKNISKLTYKELQNLQIDENEKDIFWKIYFKEFMKSFEDSKEKRLNIIEDVRKIIN